MRNVVVALLLLTALSGCGSGDVRHYCAGTSTKGCTPVPTDAKKADFCKAGEAFSESKGFANGQQAARALAAVGTPRGIPATARSGFVELVERMADAENGPDFQSRTQAVRDHPSEREHLLDLDAYIHTACNPGVIP